MKDTPGLYDTLVQVLRQHEKWLDVRHAKTLAWMMVGLIESGMIGLTAWTPYVQGRARYAQSTVRRFRRWLDNGKIEVHDLYGPLIQQALADWGATSAVSGARHLAALGSILHRAYFGGLSRTRRADYLAGVGAWQQRCELRHLPGALRQGSSATAGALSGRVSRRSWLRRYRFNASSATIRLALAHSDQKQLLDLSPPPRSLPTEPS